ncbi:uncharacterized protein N7483_010608 [Penicillium malachiteum]|uniref:uncharacterized protein n=1 Tax=Penicillium malachiteum TaxID=1324776 RepID=UPI0025474638|nr:uncharacterized protein N7483_010608 [Penicillium malachiteum]KAJ5713427.1 hypothetical protein N7483_010608 [Penicillium malachiteum]
MSTKAPPSQTGDTAPSTTSTTSTLETPKSDAQILQNNQVIKEDTKSPDSGVGDDLPGDTSPGGFTLLMTVAALAMSMFLVSLDMTIVATAIPKITDEFGGIEDEGWYGSAFFITLGSFQAAWGKAYKYFPLKKSFLISIFIFEVGSVAPSSIALIVGRAVTGVGGAGISSGAFTIIALSAPPKQRPAYIGILGASYGIAAAIGPLVGGAFTSNVTWRWCFYINLPIGGLAADTQLKEKILQMDLGGTLLLLSALVCYVLALQWGGISLPWSDSKVVGTLVGFLILLIVYGIVQWLQKERAAMIGRLFRRNVIITMIYIDLLAGTFFLLVYYLPIYFQVVSGASAAQSGIRNLPLILAQSVATVVSGVTLSKYAYPQPFLLTGAALTAIGSGLLYTLEINTGSGKWIGYQLLAGIGIGWCFQVPVVTAQASVKPEDLPSVTAMVLTVQTIGGSVFVSAGQSAMVNVLLNVLRGETSTVDASKVAMTGATELREVFSSEQMSYILGAYMQGLQAAFLVAVVASCLATVICGDGRCSFNVSGSHFTTNVIMLANSHSPPPPPEDQQPPRKRIRKGTRSCWECKHRKVRCHYVSGGDSSCRECLARGTVCRSQDFPEPENLRESDRTSLNDRLGRVESLLERVLRRLDTLDDKREPPVSPPTGTVDSSNPSSSTAITPANENAPVLSLFNNGVLGFQRPDASPPNITLYGTTNREWEKLRHELLALLPSSSTLKRLEANGCWWLVRAQCFQDYEESLLPCSLASFSTRHPVVIAKALLWVAICLQQLPRVFAVESLELPCPLAELIAKCVNIVAHSISSDETLVSGIDGLECLVLQGIFYNNDGKLRSAWLSYRRALNVGQIIGLHRLALKEEHDSESISRAKHIWNHILYADRYLSLMLGMYHGITDVALDSQRVPSETPSYSMDILCRIAGSIIERNQKFTTVTPLMARMTQTIDSELMSVDPPEVAEETDIPTSGKSMQRAWAYDKLMARLWYYQLLAWLHLPLLLESGAHGRYDYSRQSCLEASRHMITCYISMRRLTAESFCCKSLDFQAFTAAVTLMISLIGPGGQSQSSPNDWRAVESVMETLEKLAEGQPPDKVATRGLSVLRILKSVAKGERPSQSANFAGLSTEDDQSNCVKVDIPYFGTISLDCGIHGNYSDNRSSDSVPARPLRPSIHMDFGESSLQAGILSDSSNTQGQLTDGAPGIRVEMEPADIWTFDPELTTLPPFLSEFGDNWDLGL